MTVTKQNPCPHNSFLLHISHSEHDNFGCEPLRRYNEDIQGPYLTLSIYRCDLVKKFFFPIEKSVFLMLISTSMFYPIPICLFFQEKKEILSSRESYKIVWSSLFSNRKIRQNDRVSYLSKRKKVYFYQVIIRSKLHRCRCPPRFLSAYFSKIYFQ